MPREDLDRILTVLPAQYHSKILRILLRKSNPVLKAVLDKLSCLIESFTTSHGVTYVGVPDFDVSTPSPGPSGFTLPGDQRQQVLADSGGWILEENVTYVETHELDWNGLKMFIDSLTDDNVSEAIVARLKSR